MLKTFVFDYAIIEFVVESLRSRLHDKRYVHVTQKRLFFVIYVFTKSRY